jgi:predicted RNA-binding Zn ribbon-like protein
VDWLVTARLLEASAASKLKRRSSIKALDGAAAQAREVRQWASAWISRWSRRPSASYQAEVTRLNELLRGANCYRELTSTDDGIRIAERCRADSADDLIGLIAMPVAALITDEQPSLVKRCAGPECTLWFLDRTKAHSRRFCSAAACGNRAKVAAFRERQRAT